MNLNMINKLKKSEENNEKKEIVPLLSSYSHHGNRHSINDDTALTAEHESLEGVKLLIVADGVGGCGKGYLASSMFCEEMKKWFNSLNVLDIDSNLSNRLISAIKTADVNIEKKHHGEASTVASVILITPNNTYISTVGDTRVYLEQNGNLSPIERIENHYDKATKLNENLHFDPSTAKRAPEGYIGYGSDTWYLCNPEVMIIPTDSYDGILAVSDGVYNDLDNQALTTLFNECYSEDIAETMIQFAQTGKIENSEYIHLIEKCNCFDNYYHDDATAVVYKKYPKIKKQSEIFQYACSVFTILEQAIQLTMERYNIAENEEIRKQFRDKVYEKISQSGDITIITPYNGAREKVEKILGGKDGKIDLELYEVALMAYGTERLGIIDIDEVESNIDKPRTL